MRLSYDTYIALKFLLEGELHKLHTEYVIALGFLPITGESPSVTETAHKVYQTRRQRLVRQMEELHAVTAESYKNHPDLQMRKFWGIPV